MIRIQTHTAEETRQLGATLANALATLPSALAQQPIVIALHGELGAGKTTFVSGFLRTLGVAGSVRSPTYTLIEPYEFASRAVYHLDLYRLANARDLEMLALRDLLNDRSVLLVEWADKGGNALPKPDLTLKISYPLDGIIVADRWVSIEASSMAGKELALSLQGSTDEANVSS